MCMNKLIRIYLFLVLIIISGNVIGQDQGFSQFFNNPVYYNPANVGLSKGLMARFSYRNQWPGLNNDLTSYNFSLEVSERNIPGMGGVGLLFSSSDYGLQLLSTSMLGVITSVRIPVSQNMVSQFGAMVSFTQKKINWDDLVFSDQLDPRYGNINPTSFSHPNAQNISFADVNLGGVLQGKFNNITSTFGIAAHHLFQPNESFIDGSAPLARRFVIHGDLIFDNKNSSKSVSSAKLNMKINPGFILENQAGLNKYAIGLNMLFENLYTGFWFRNEEFSFLNYTSITLLAGLYIPLSNKNTMKVMYSYDLAISKFYAGSGGAHEVHITISFDDINLFSWKNDFQVYRKRGDVLECSPF